MGLTAKKRGSVFWAYGTVRGQRIRQSLGTSDPSRAEEARAELEARVWRQGLYGDKAVRTFEEAALSYMQAGGEGRYLAPLIAHFRGQEVDTIRPGHIRDAARKLYPKGAPATQRRQAITPAVAVINHAHDKGWCGAVRVKFKAGKKPRRQAVDRAYIDTLRAACLSRKYPAKHLAALMLFLHQTGARLGEALVLTPEDVQGNVAIAHETKNGEARRIALTSEIMADLAGLKPRHGLVFGYANRRGVYRALQAICAEAGLAYLGTHQPGRHSFATTLDALGFTAAAIAEAGGWKSRALVAQVYTHPQKAARRAAEAMDKGNSEAHTAENDPQANDS